MSTAASLADVSKPTAPFPRPVAAHLVIFHPPLAAPEAAHLAACQLPLTAEEANWTEVSFRAVAVWKVPLASVETTCTVPFVMAPVMALGAA